MQSHIAMSTAPLAVSLWIVRAMTAWAFSRSKTDSPCSCGAKMSSITATIDFCVSPYVYGRGGVSAQPTTPSTVSTRTST